MMGKTETANIGTGNVESRRRAGVPDPTFFQGARPDKTGPAPSVALLERFPPRPLPERWEWTELSHQQVIARLSASPFTVERAGMQQDRRRGLHHVLEWLGRQRGGTWQDRWTASGADAMGNVAWRDLPMQSLKRRRAGSTDSASVSLSIGRGMLVLVSGDVIRPSLGWLLSPGTPRNLVAELARTRDPDGFATLTKLAEASLVNVHTMGLALRRVATIVAAKGGVIADINIGDCLELLRVADDLQVSLHASWR